MKLSARKKTELDLKCISLIGTKLKIIDSKIKNQIELEGVLVYESANMLFLDIGGRIVKIFKNNVKLQFEYKGQPLNMDAHFLYSTIINRIKKIK